MPSHPPFCALVTGGSRGIGRAIARRLAADGGRVAFLYHRPHPRVHGVLRALARSSKHSPAACQADLAHDAEVRRAARDVLEFFGGRLDVLVNNASYTAAGSWNTPFQRLRRDRLDRTWDVDVMGTIRLTQLLLPALRRSRRASVIHVTSSAAMLGDASVMLYAAAKGALVTLTKAMAVALGPRIRVNALAPGSIATDWIRDWRLSAAERRALEAEVPLRRLGRPEEVAAAAAFLASPRSRSITGQILFVDGGMNMTS